MEQKIIEILKEYIEGLENADVWEDTQLIAKGLLESFDVINLLLVLEEAFDVDLVPDLLQLEDFNSPKTIAAMIERCRG